MWRLRKQLSDYSDSEIPSLGLSADSMRQRMKNISEFDSLTSFKRSSAKFISRLKKTGAPVALTHNGKAEIVVQSARAYQQLIEMVDWAEAIEGISKGLEQVRAGKLRDALAVLQELGRKHRLSRKNRF
jgi:PHD/YefM family antitoxin component YafN of YafNO toxin-antitoxin module